MQENYNLLISIAALIEKKWTFGFFLVFCSSLMLPFFGFSFCGWLEAVAAFDDDFCEEGVARLVVA